MAFRNYHSLDEDFMLSFVLLRIRMSVASQTTLTWILSFFKLGVRLGMTQERILNQGLEWIGVKYESCEI